MVYDLLFCDDLELYRSDATSSVNYPWNDLFDPEVTVPTLKEIVVDPELDSRIKIIASNLLAERNDPAPDKIVYGVIVEVGLDDGLDVLAAYEDGTARYINFSEKIIIWETRTAESDELIADLFAAANTLVAQIGPWDGERLPPPTIGNARISFLVSDGIYFGEAPFGDLGQDPMGGAVLERAAKLMAFLIKNSVDQPA